MKIGSFSISPIIAVALIGALVVWSFTPPFFVQKASAASLVGFSDTLSDSDLGNGSNHTIVFTTTNGVSAGESFTVTLSSFTIPGGLDFEDIDLATTTGQEAPLAAAPSGGTWGVTHDGTTLTFVSGTDEIASSSVVTIKIGTNAVFGATGDLQVTNPSSQNSYIISASLPVDSGETRVAIVNDVLVTATVDSAFNFTVGSVAAGEAINGSATTTRFTSSATALAFGTLDSSSATSALMAQTLSVVTNSVNGFSVTVWADALLTSESGATIDGFRTQDGGNGATSTSPTAWVSPEGVLNFESSYGHFGLTTEDGTLSPSGDTFGSDEYVGDFFDINNPVEVFYHDGVADGTTAGQGTTRVGYRAEITALQEAGTLYTNTLTYIATPVF